MVEASVTLKKPDPVIIPAKTVEELQSWYRGFTMVHRRSPVITLCGSSKFKKEFEEVSLDLSLMGFIVISLGLFGHADHPEIMIDHDIKSMLDANHKQKISMSDGIFVVDPGNYIGESTRSEIEYAQKKKRRIWYLV